MLAALLLGLWGSLLIARGTPVGRSLHHWMVEAPARRLSRISRGQILLALVTGSLVVATIWLLENDGRMLVATGLPDVLAFATAIDLATLLDLTAVAVVAATAIRVRSVAGWVAQRVTPRARRREQRVGRPARRPSANDDDRPAFALAA